MWKCWTPKRDPIDPHSARKRAEGTCALPRRAGEWRALERSRDDGTGSLSELCHLRCRHAQEPASASSTVAPATAQQVRSARPAHGKRAARGSHVHARAERVGRAADQRGSTLQAAKGLLLKVTSGRAGRAPVGSAAGGAAHPASGRASSTQGMRARVRWTAAWQLPSQRASRAHQLTSKQHPWAFRASVAARVVSRACPRLSQHWRRSPTKSQRCWQLPCRRNTID